MDSTFSQFKRGIVFSSGTFTALDDDEDERWQLLERPLVEPRLKFFTITKILHHYYANFSHPKRYIDETSGAECWSRRRLTSDSISLQ